MFKSLILVLLLALNGFAAIPAANQNAKNIIKYQGALSGGVAGGGFSLLKMNKIALAQNKGERWIIDIGDIKGKSNKGVPGYYHVQVTQNPPQLVIDFNQMPVSIFSESELTKMVQSSVFMSKGRLLSDPTDKTLTMIFDLKKPSQVKVMQVIGKKETSKVVLDLSL